MDAITFMEEHGEKLRLGIINPEWCSTLYQFVEECADKDFKDAIKYLEIVFKDMIIYKYCNYLQTDDLIEELDDALCRLRGLCSRDYTLKKVEKHFSANASMIYNETINEININLHVPKNKFPENISQDFCNFKNLIDIDFRDQFLTANAYTNEAKYALKMTNKKEEKSEIITLCGSYKFTDIIMESFKQLTDAGYLVFIPAINCVDTEKEFYMNLHYKRILASDIVFIVDPDGYIGESVKNEINKAKEYDKPIYYYSNNGIETLKSKRIPKMDKIKFFEEYGDDIKKGNINKELAEMIYDQLKNYIKLDYEEVMDRFIDILTYMVVYLFHNQQTKELVITLTTAFHNLSIKCLDNESFIIENISKDIADNLDDHIDYAIKCVKNDLSLDLYTNYNPVKMYLKRVATLENFLDNNFVKRFLIDHMSKNNEEVKNELRLLGFIDEDISEEVN